MRREQQEQDMEYSFPYHYIPQYKDGFTQNYNWIWSKQYVSAIEFILDEIKSSKEAVKSICDLGCGDGRLTKELAECFVDKDVAGIDYSSRAINLAKALNPNINYIKQDIINDTIERKFDAITLIEVFEHIPLELCNDFVKSTSKILNNNGILYLTVPHINNPVNDKHFQHFSYNSLVKYFENEFTVEQVYYIQKYDKLLSILNLLMTNKVWIINSKFINSIFYRLYKKIYFFADDKTCGRIYLKLKKK
jgi:2-polyprenyl-3-methyl-5-hydroxy-6-metoxy-1,4-benzoquinol methylase